MSTLAASKKAAGVERCGLVRENCLSVQCTILPARLATMIPKSGGDVESRNHVPSRNTLECGGHATLVHVRGNLDGRNLSSVENSRVLQRGNFQNRIVGTISTSAGRNSISEIG
jgi:hypothetical protein